MADDQQEIHFVDYTSELQLPAVIQLIENDLSEPYSIYTYRYFIHNWPKLCFLVTLVWRERRATFFILSLIHAWPWQAMDADRCVGVIICKLDQHKDRNRGYIAMLAVAKEYRKRAIGTTLVQRAIRAMKEQDADEVYVLRRLLVARRMILTPSNRLYWRLNIPIKAPLLYINDLDSSRINDYIDIISMG